MPVAGGEVRNVFSTPALETYAIDGSTLFWSSAVDVNAFDLASGANRDLNLHEQLLFAHDGVLYLNTLDSLVAMSPGGAQTVVYQQETPSKALEITADDSTLYWSTIPYVSLYSKPLAGGAVTALDTNINKVLAQCAVNGSLYIAEYDRPTLGVPANSIVRYVGSKRTVLASHQDDIEGLVVLGSRVYWTAGGSLQSAPR